MSRRNTQKIILNDEVKQEILKYSRCGLLDEKIYMLLGWSKASYYDILSKNPEFSREVKNCKLIADSDMEESIYQMGLGFHKKEEKVVILSGGLHSKSTSETVEFERYHPPNLAAAKHYLHNRNPDRWKDKTELVIKAEDLTMEELEKMAMEILAKKKKDEGDGE